jgi:hypothetical protein
MRANLRLWHFSPRTEEACTAWTRRFVGSQPVVPSHGASRDQGPAPWHYDCASCNALTLRVKDLDRGEVRIRRGKGTKDRVTVLPGMLRTALAAQLESVRGLHQRDCRLGENAGWVTVPDALDRRYPQARRALQ